MKLRFPMPLFDPREPARGDLTDSSGGAEPPPVVEATVESAPAPVVEPAPSIPLDVFQKRIGVLTAQKKELERQLAERPAVSPSLAPTADPAPANLDALARQRAQQMRFEERITDISNDIANAGHGIAPDFLPRVGTMSQILGIGPELYVETIYEAAERDPKAAAELLYELAKDPAKAGTIFSMIPTRQVMTLAKMAKPRGGVPSPTPLAPPAPIAPKVGGYAPRREAPVNLNDAKTSIDDWMKERDATARRRR